MPAISARRWRRLLQIGGSSALYAVASCVQLPSPTASVTVPPIPAGEARAWFYRDEGPYGNRVSSYVLINGSSVEELQPRGAIYRDLPQGHYHIAVQNYVGNVNATRDVDLAPGQQVYFKIVANDDSSSGGSFYGETGNSRVTYNLWLMPSEWGKGEVARSPFYGGS